jgi:hypothetical protein
MNHKRRRALNELADKLDRLKDELELLYGEEQEVSERSGGKLAEAAESTCAELEAALDSLDDCISGIRTVTEI